MRGHIQQRGKTSWRVKAYVGRDADGVRRYVERTIRGRRREAERELSRLLVEVDEGRHAAAAPITGQRWGLIARSPAVDAPPPTRRWVPLTAARLNEIARSESPGFEPASQ